jgi:hypothetical protein
MFFSHLNISQFFVPQRLATALGAGAGVHRERVADPEGAPAGGAVGDLDGLRVDRL